MNFRDRMINIPCDATDVDCAYANRHAAYTAGWRHTRHAAAGIANEADALIAELYSALRALQGNFNEQTIARAREAMAAYHEQYKVTN